MSAGAVLWARLVLFGLLACATLVVLSPPRPEHVPLATSLLPAAFAGALLFTVLHGRGARLALPRLPVAVTVGRVAVMVALAVQEEVLWRRAVLGEALPASTVFALGVSTLGFALVHRVGRAKQVCTGATFGGVYVLSGSVVAASVTHAVFNLLVAATVDAARARAVASPA